jgi:uncharacterized membrane protein YgcG
MTMTTKSISSFLFTGLFTGLFASVAVAQTPTAGPRWSAYAGCWEPVAAEGQIIPANAPRVCVVPSGGAGADLLSVVDNKITERTHVEGDGARHDVKRQGCEGWESAAWSSDGRRLYFNSNQKCDAVDAAGRTTSVDVVSAGLERKASGIFAVGPTGQWTNIVNVSASGGHGLRVLRYAPVSIDSTYPAEIFTALGNRDMFFNTARIAARSGIKLDDVIDATKSVEPAVVEAWLATSDQRFDLDAKTLVRLADAGVPPETIDVMVAMSNPGVFAVASNGSGVSELETSRPANRAAHDDCYSSQVMDPWGYHDYACDPYRRYGARGYYDPFNPYGGYGFGYNPYGYNPYGYNPYGFNSYGYNYGYSGTPVVIIVRGSATDPLVTHGHMTKNGYTTSTPSTGGSAPRQATTRSSDGSSGSTSSSSGSSSRGSSSSGSSSSGSSGGDRTAHPKPPTR